MRFTPDYQKQVCNDPDLCFFGDFPTLSQIKAYGINFAGTWLLPQLYNLSEYCGCKEKLQGKPIEDCADVIASEFHYLKISEMMLFFYRFKSGRYGKFYGSVDPLVITTSIRDFLKERIYAYEQHDKREREWKEMESRKNYVSWKDYCMKEYGEERPYPQFGNIEHKDKEPELDEQEALSTARWIVSVKDEAVRETYGSVFEKKYGCTPKEFIDNYETTKK